MRGNDGRALGDPSEMTINLGNPLPAKANRGSIAPLKNNNIIIINI